MSEVQTVLGPIRSADLGTTMMHEHLCPRAQVPAPEDGKPPYAPRPGVEDVVRELIHLREVYGVCSIVDCTPRRTPDELEVLARIAEASAINVVAATGCQKEQYYHTARNTVSSFWAYQLAPDEIADVLVREIDE